MYFGSTDRNVCVKETLLISYKIFSEAKTQERSEFKSRWNLPLLYSISVINRLMKLSSLLDKLKITYSRSSGPGGQHVNKVSTKAEVRFHVQTAEWIPEEVRREILLKNKTRVNKAGELIVTSEISRSQKRNLEDCLQKISEMITEASQQKPQPSEEDIALRAHRLEKINLERLKQKKLHAATKQARRVDFD
uniref:Large ribosomal subunit protein mL62 n=1 Tax=Sinocyclocheilus anshuiensis TaxID=1608454 RepID=A0A671R8J4_9TELE